MESGHTLPSTSSLLKYVKAVGHKAETKLKAGYEGITRTDQTYRMAEWARCLAAGADSVMFAS